MSTDFEGLGSKLLVATFYDFLTSFQKNVKRHVFLKSEKNAKYVISNTALRILTHPNPFKVNPSNQDQSTQPMHGPMRHSTLPYLGADQTWNWVIGSPGQWVIFHVRVTGSSFRPDARPEFFRFSKNAQNSKRIHLKC